MGLEIGSVSTARGGTGVAGETDGEDGISCNTSHSLGAVLTYNRYASLRFYRPPLIFHLALVGATAGGGEMEDYQPPIAPSRFAGDLLWRWGDTYRWRR